MEKIIEFDFIQKLIKSRVHCIRFINFRKNQVWWQKNEMIYQVISKFYGLTNIQTQENQDVIIDKHTWLSAMMAIMSKSHFCLEIINTFRHFIVETKGKNARKNQKLNKNNKR